MTNIFNFVGWLNFCKLINFCLFVGLFHCLMFYHQDLLYTTWSSGITHYVSKCHSKSILMLFDAHWLIKKFHGTFSRVPWNFSWNFSNNICTTYVGLWNSMVLKQHKLKFHGIPLNFVQIQSSMKFHGTFPYPRVPWNSMELFLSSMEFHDVPWNLKNLIFKKSYC